MKKIIFILCLTAFVGCKSRKIEKPAEIKIAKLELSQVDFNKRQRTYELGKRILMTCNTSKFKPFTSNEATASVINNITLEKLSKTCTKYRQWYGTFKDLELAEVYRNTNDQTTIYRFRALYSKKVANKELRVFINSDNLVSSIKTSDWAATFSYNQ